MELEIVTVVLAVFVAATLQAATGIGFGIIAGPILLAVMNDSSAIQVSIVLNLVIAILLLPSVWKQIESSVAINLGIGVTVGSPIGLWVFSVLPLTYLKGLAGLLILTTLAMLVVRTHAPAHKKELSHGRIENVSVGTVAGILGSSLAMPGPIPAAWMSAKGFDKDAIRGTILAMFAIAYSLALILQVLEPGITEATLTKSANLSVPTIAGIVLGKILSRRVSERAFRVTLLIVLVVTFTTLTLSIVE